MKTQTHVHKHHTYGSSYNKIQWEENEESQVIYTFSFYNSFWA